MKDKHTPFQWGFGIAFGCLGAFVFTVVLLAIGFMWIANSETDGLSPKNVVAQTVKADEKQDKSTTVTDPQNNGLRYAEHLVIENVIPHFEDGASGVAFDVRNDGNKTVTGLAIRIYFLGDPPGYVPIDETEGGVFGRDGDSPLRPGYVRSFDLDVTDSAPPDFYGAVSVEITKVITQ